MKKPVKSNGHFWLNGNGGKECCSKREIMNRVKARHKRDGVSDLTVEITDRGDCYSVFSYYPMRPTNR